jgi:hypothetical protein
MYNAIYSYFQQFPNASVPEFHAWAGEYLGLAPEAADSSLKCLVSYLQKMNQAQGPSYHFGPPARYYSTPLKKPIGCNCCELTPVRMHNAGFGWPKGDLDGHGYPARGMCLPQGYGPNRM